jgi:hypothetical protein
MPLLLRRILFWLFATGILYAAWLLAMISLPHTSLGRYVGFLITKQLVYDIRHWRISFYTHVFTSTFVLIAGLLQCSDWVLKNYPGLHRKAGMVYVMIVLFFSGPSGLMMSFYANGGLPARISFVLLSCLWLLTTALGWRYARQGRWQAHGEMMLRSYALTLSAITLRFYTLLLGLMHIPSHPEAAYILVSWLSWTINLLIVEMLIRRGLFPLPTKRSSF